MEYAADFYPRLYYFMVYLAWWVWIAMNGFFLYIKCDLDDKGHKDRNSIKYKMMITIIATFFIGVLICIFMPSPELFGLVEIDT